MACNCINEDGERRSICLGTCDKSKVIEQQKEQSRSGLQEMMDIIHERVNMIVNDKIAYTRVEFQREQVQTYNFAFMEGIEFGIELFKRHGKF